VLGNLLGLPGFEHDSAEAVRDEALAGTDAAKRLSNAPIGASSVTTALRGLERVSDVPIYCTDSLVRRAASLQATRDAQPPAVGLPTSLWQQLGLRDGSSVRVSQGTASAVLPAREDASLAATAVRVAAAHPSTASLGPMFGAIGVTAA
jgi:NADH-quinone oxidoreductase subunit G